MSKPRHSTNDAKARRRKVERLNMVLERITLGKPQRLIERELSELWDCGERQVRKYIAVARQHLADAAPPAEEMRKSISQGLALIGQRALDSGKLDVARRVFVDMARLNGLLINREEVSGPGGGPIPIEQTARVYLPADRIDEMPPEEPAPMPEEDKPAE